MAIDLIRNKPVFDIEALKPGVAIKFKSNRDCHLNLKTWYNALIVRMDLNNLEVVIYDGEDDIEAYDIHITDVLEEATEIELLF